MSHAWKTWPTTERRITPYLENAGECIRVVQMKWGLAETETKPRTSLFLWGETETNIPNSVLYQRQWSSGEVIIQLSERSKNMSRQLETAYKFSGQTCLSVENPHGPGLVLHTETDDRVNLSIKEKVVLLWLVFDRNGMLQKALYLTYQHHATCMTLFKGWKCARWGRKYTSLLFFPP